MNKESYNEEPVYFCNKCKSLRIMYLNADSVYCDVCGSTEVKRDSIFNWDVLYQNKYKKPFIKNKEDGRR